MTITSSDIQQQLEPGLNAIVEHASLMHQNQHLDLFDLESSNRAFEEEVVVSGFGYADVKPEGSAVTFQDSSEHYTARYQHLTIASAFAITKEAVEDNLYDKKAARMTKAMVGAMNTTKQNRAASLYNNAFNTSFTFGDGKALCVTDHPLLNGGTFSNRQSADLSEAALEQALIDIGNLVDTAGLPISVMAKMLIVPVQSQFIANRILNTDLRPGTADNDINAMKYMGMFPGGIKVNNFLTDPDSWYIRTDAPDGLKHFVRVPLETAMEGKFETDTMRVKFRERYSFGVTDPRGIYGSDGV